MQCIFAIAGSNTNGYTKLVLPTHHLFTPDGFPTILSIWKWSYGFALYIYMLINVWNCVALEEEWEWTHNACNVDNIAGTSQIPGIFICQREIVCIHLVLSSCIADKLSQRLYKLWICVCVCLSVCIWVTEFEYQLIRFSLSLSMQCNAMQSGHIMCIPYISIREIMSIS